MIELLYLNGNYTIYDKKLSRKLQKPAINLTDSYFLQLKKSKTKNFSCLGGAEDGPTYNGHDYDAYYYQNKQYPEQNKKGKTTSN